MPSIVKDEDSEEVVYARCALNEARYIYGLLRRNADEAREKADKWKQDEVDCEKKRNEAVTMLRGGDEYTGDEARSELQSLMISELTGTEAGLVGYWDFNKNLTKAIRAHGNFFEFTVFFIISSFLLELLDGALFYIFLVNIIFFLGRISHAYSMFKEKLLFRQIGMMATLTCYVFNCIYLLYLYWQYFKQLD